MIYSRMSEIDFQYCLRVFFNFIRDQNVMTTYGYNFSFDFQSDVLFFLFLLTNLKSSNIYLNKKSKSKSNFNPFM